MNTGNWTKLYQNTIFSTIWQEPAAIRCVWITMLMLADSEGYVGASVPGLAKAANVELGVTEAALQQFQLPDKYSRSKEHDGRRIVEAPGGWQILNFLEHRNGNEDQREKWARQKRNQRANKKREQAGSGAPLAGEREYVKALERGDTAGAERILEAGLPDPSPTVFKAAPYEQGPSATPLPVQGNPSTSGSQGEDGGSVGGRSDTGQSGPRLPPGEPTSDPAVETGRFINGEWVPEA